jgi:VanZ family protein
MSSKSTKQHGLGFWIATWWPVVAAIGIICLESTEMMGANYTSGPFRHFFEAIFGPVSDHRWEHVHMLIRKSGHFIGYGLVGLAWFRAWARSFSRLSFYRPALLAIAGTALVASCDEYHQTFLPNRTGTYKDVLIDCTGAIVLLTVEYFVLRLLSSPRIASKKRARLA